MAQSALTSARIEPTDRSMPPVVITSVMAAATISSGADWRRMFRMLPSVRKSSVVAENSTTTKRKNSGDGADAAVGKKAIPQSARPQPRRGRLGRTMRLDRS